MTHPLTVAEIIAVVLRPSDRLFVADARQFRLRRGGESRIQWTVAALRTNGLRGVRDLLVNVHGLVLMQTENVHVLHFENRVAGDSPAIAEIEFLGHRV